MIKSIVCNLILAKSSVACYTNQYACVMVEPMHFCISIFFNRYGVLYKEQKLFAEAREMFVKSCQLCPTLWASWEELSKLCDDKTMVSGTISVNKIKILFTAEA